MTAATTKSDGKPVVARRVVVTGGAGFIGTNLIRALGSQHRSITAIDDLSNGRARNLDGTSASLVVGSLCDRDLVAKCVADADVVVHLAALGSVSRSVADPIATHEANVNGTITLLEACRHLDPMPHVIVASSSSVYGANPTLPKHEALAPMPMSPYAVSKLAAEQYALAFAQTYGLPVLAFRFFNVFGPFQPAGHAYAAAIPTFIAAALAKQPIPIYGDGRQTRDFTFVGSVVDVVADAMARRVTHPTPVNLAFGTRHSLLDIIAVIEATLGREVTIEHHPPRTSDVRDSQADSAVLRHLFPAAHPTPIDRGIEATVAWMKSPSA